MFYFFLGGDADVEVGDADADADAEVQNSSYKRPKINAQHFCRAFQRFFFLGIFLFVKNCLVFLVSFLRGVLVKKRTWTQCELGKNM